ncbi:hypothetical protein FPZ43_17500 [Mucilaginibacter pallidiroseus]|uniref:HNH domain-containing protein n=1 Tax=Mucilaginibacter pallidiroseus TaxID=2599295 RepID=A0A563U0W1_9SPHI|nr:hypothetical protein [Mucilaginibacter pallidiroseus]TWR25264.1 hypothetical protein FPZ43_17500 [Mucilaginibacter pallidiroseus]
MRELKYYNAKSTIDYYDDVVKSKSVTKKDPDYHTRLGFLKGDIAKLFSTYEEKFLTNKLEELVSFGYSGVQKTDLHKLYRYKSKALQNLKTLLTTAGNNRIISTCQNCTISEINSFDHYVPQEKYAEFVINPHNLIPSCTICNGFKSDEWITDNKRQFLNLYLDSLPRHQYLFVTVKVENFNMITAKFQLSNKNKIANDKYALIYSHYDKLNLLERFSENIDMVVTPLVNTVKSYLSKLSFDDIKESQMEKIEKDKIAFGFNNWKSILEESLLNSKEFIDSIILNNI